MRLLLPIVLLLAVAGTAYLLLRGDASGTTAGTGPNASPAVADAARPALDLARGDRPATSRAAVATPEATTGAAGGTAENLTAEQLAAANGLAPAVPEPQMEGGATVGAVGTSAVSDSDEALALKYLNWSRAERVQALQTLRTTLELQRSSPDKDVQASLPSLKHEMGWLESNLDG